MRDLIVQSKGLVLDFNDSVMKSINFCVHLMKKLLVCIPLSILKIEYVIISVIISSSWNGGIS